MKISDFAFPRRTLLVCTAMAVAGIRIPSLAAEPVAVQSRRIDLDYSVNDAALPLDAVELFYTTDEGTTWTLFGEDEDRQPPMTFQAAGDGLFGFLFVLKNAAGASSEAPARGTVPQASVLVDQTPPLLQLHPLRLTDAGDRLSLQVRWTAVDTQFGPRPIEILYQRSRQAEWTAMTPQPLANTGRFDWRIPDDFAGAISVRVVARDNGGHCVQSDPQGFEVPTLRSTQALANTTTPTLAGRETSVPSASKPETAALAGSKRAKERAQRLLTEAIVLGQRGELREAVSRTREAVKLDPELTEAFTEMGNLLLRFGDLDRSLNAYEIAMRQKPAARDALVGAARVHAQQKDYPAAAERLRTVLRYNPGDAEVWMNLGDVAVYRGDDVAAREYYLRATQIDPSAAKVIADAKKRLLIMADATGPTPVKKP